MKNRIKIDVLLSGFGQASADVFSVEPPCFYCGAPIDPESDHTYYYECSYNVKRYNVEKRMLENVEDSSGAKLVGKYKFKLPYCPQHIAPVKFFKTIDIIFLILGALTGLGLCISMYRSATNRDNLLVPFLGAMICVPPLFVLFGLGLKKIITLFIPKLKDYPLRSNGHYGIQINNVTLHMSDGPMLVPLTHMLSLSFSDPVAAQRFIEANLGGLKIKKGENLLKSTTPPVAREQLLKVQERAGGVGALVGGALAKDALRALRLQVEQLGTDYPRQHKPDLDPKLDKQLPWICWTLEEAANALERGVDRFGNLITTSQVCVGLRTLIRMVRDPGYLFVMELGHPGIARPLEQYMGQLEQIIEGVEGASATAASSGSRGVDTLVALCTEMGILSPDQYVDRAVEELRQEGESGSRALAMLVRELLACRSPKIEHVLRASGRVAAMPELLSAVGAVAGASELTEAPAQPRFTAEIMGGGRVGWTSGTHHSVVRTALEAQASLEGRD